jgi:hypothetical protein
MPAKKLCPEDYFWVPFSRLLFLLLYSYIAQSFCHRGRKRPSQFIHLSSPKHLLQNVISGIFPSLSHIVYRLEMYAFTGCSRRLMCVLLVAPATCEFHWLLLPKYVFYYLLLPKYVFYWLLPSKCVFCWLLLPTCAFCWLQPPKYVFY